jgi:hypothetical protein
MTQLIVLASTSVEDAEQVDTALSFFIGGSVLLVLLLLMGALLAFGGGREHS